MIREHPSIDSCHQSCDLYIHYRGPTQWLWVDHPADELVQLTNSYTSSVKNMISNSSDEFHQAVNRYSSRRTCEMNVHFIMIRLRPFRQFLSGPQQILQTLRHVWRPDPAEEISSFSSPPTSEGVAKSSSFYEQHMRRVAKMPNHFVSHKRG